MGLKVTRIATAGQELAGGYALDATYAGDDADITTGLPLDGLLDVTTPTPVDGDGIVWRDAESAWVNEHALTEADVLAMITPDVYACASLTATNGTIAAGAHTDLHAVGGTTVQVNEASGAPGILVTAAFTGVDGIDHVYVHGYYDGNHTDMHVQLYNYDTTAWDTVTTFPAGGSSMTLLAGVIADGAPYFDGSGNAQVRFYHATAGNPSHRLYLDYLAVSHTTGSTGGLALNDLTDVDTTGKADQDVLTWDNGTTTWIAAAAPSGSGIPATLLDAKGDLIVASAADTAARLAVGGTNGHVLTVDSGETTGVKWAAPAASSGTRAFGLDPVTVDGTYGDEFDGASLNGRWTRHNQTSGMETYQSGGLASALRVAHGATNAAEYIYQTAPNGTNETWNTSVSWYQETATGQMFGLLMVDTSGNGVAVLRYDNANGLYLANVASHTYSSALAFNSGLQVSTAYYQGGGRLWLRLRKASGVYYATYSIDGQDWAREVSGTPSAFTPARVGIGRFLGTNANSIGVWHWFDKSQ